MAMVGQRVMKQGSNSRGMAMGPGWQIKCNAHASYFFVQFCFIFLFFSEYIRCY